MILMTDNGPVAVNAEALRGREGTATPDLCQVCRRSDGLPMVLVSGDDRKLFTAHPACAAARGFTVAEIA